MTNQLVCIIYKKKIFQDHQSILKIKKSFNVTDFFSFHEITEDEIRKEISKLDGSF